MSYTSFEHTILLLAASGVKLSDLKGLQGLDATQTDYESNEVVENKVLPASV